MEQVEIRNLTRSLKKTLRVRYCERFLCKLRGLMFKAKLDPDDGLLFADPKSTRVNAGIHMLGMFIDLSIIWLDEDKRVVDKALARRWVSFVFPHKPARYVIECAVSRHEEFTIGDQIAFK
jgi:uncharacterized membrane protein (UPF0127 family)